MFMNIYSARQWHDGLKRLGKTGMPFRTTSVQDEPTRRTTEFNSLRPYWIDARSPMDCTWVSSGSRSMSQNCVPHSAHSGLPQICSALDTPEISEVQQWHRYVVAQALLDRYQRVGEDFLDETSLWTKPGLAQMNQTWNVNQMNGSIQFFSSKKSAPYTCVMKVMFIVVHDIDGVLLHNTVPPRYTVNAVNYCTFLQHDLSPELRRKRSALPTKRIFR